MNVEMVIETEGSECKDKECKWTCILDKGFLDGRCSPSSNQCQCLNDFGWL